MSALADAVFQPEDRDGALVLYASTSSYRTLVSALISPYKIANRKSKSKPFILEGGGRVCFVAWVGVMRRGGGERVSVWGDMGVIIGKWGR